MKKVVSLLIVCMLACVSPLALAQGVMLRTFTPFADMDFAAQAYMDLITAWEEETGHVVEDYSGAADEDWMNQVKAMARAGEADIVVLPVGSGLTANELVTAAELAAAYPQLGAKAMPSMAERDGSVLLTPVRLNWEALYVNTKILKENGLAVPSSLEELVTVCAQLSAKGILPIANALGDWAEIALDCLAVSGAPGAAYGSTESFAGAKDAAVMLSMVGAFGDVLHETDDVAMDRFLAGAAAMRFDSDFLAYDLAGEMAQVVTVIAPPARAGTVSGAAVGLPGIGLAITRSCYADPARREAAIALCEKILSSAELVSPAGSMLGEGIMQLTRAADACTGLLYDANPDGFDRWAQDVVAALGGQ